MIKEFKLKKAGTNLLLLVKTIKIATSLGLKESKDLVDKVRDGKGPISIKLDLTQEQEKDFLDSLSNVENIEYEYPSTASVRKVKFVQLGLVDDKKELIDTIMEFSSFEDVLNFLPNEVLIDLINKIKPYAQSNI